MLLDTTKFLRVCTSVLRQASIQSDTMHRYRIPYRYWTACFAVWCLVCAALVPTLNRIHFSGGNSVPQWVEVCSTSGMVRIALPTEDAAQPAQHKGLLASMDSCMWCRLHHDDLGLVPANTIEVAQADVSSTAWLKSMYRNAVLVAVWQPSQSRAPPLGTALC